MTIIPTVLPPAPKRNVWARDLQPMDALRWLGAGWQDFTTAPMASVAYGLIMFGVSVGVVLGLFAFGWDYILLPTLAGFMVVGPLFAVGLYEKSRRLVAGEPVTFTSMILVRPKSGPQLLFTGLLLSLLMLLWMRAAVLIYALFFGLRPFPGLDHILPMLFTSPVGWAMLAVGTAVGGLFAAFSFAISAFSIPWLLDSRIDALTAMGSSMAFVWNNLAVMLAWGAIVLGLIVLAIGSGFLGLIVVFPLLGHGTWHAYREIVRCGTPPASPS